MKTILKILLIIVIIGTIGLFVFWYTSNKNKLPGDQKTFSQTVKDFVPLGNLLKKEKTENQGIDLGTNQTTNEQRVIIDSPFVKISNRRVSSFIVLPKTPQDKDTFVEYIEQNSGLVYTKNTNDTMSEKMKTTSTAPQIGESFINSSGTGIIFRYARDDQKTIETYLGGIPFSDSPQKVSGQFLTQNIKGIALNPDKNQFASLIPVKDGVSVLTSDFSGGNKKTLIYTPFSDWIIEWPSNEMITLTTKASANIPGYAYQIVGGELYKVLGDINGLTTSVNKTAQVMLFSESNGFSIKLKQLNLLNNKVSETGLETLPEKCVWSKLKPTTVYCAVPNQINNGLYPDLWYKGQTVWKDSFWKLDLGNNIYNKLMDSSYYTEGLDAINLSLNEDEDELYFINKTDRTLWKIKNL